MSETDTRTMLPEVQAYIAAEKAAEQAHDEASAKVREEFPNRYIVSTDEDRRKYWSLVAAAGKAERVARDAAWAEMGKSSDDPLVRWIVEHCEEYKSEALEVLSMLPATLDELEKVAYAQEWCGTFRRFRDRAAAAGVVKLPEVSESRLAVLQWVERNSDMAPGGRERLSALLDALVAEEGKAA